MLDQSQWRQLEGLMLTARTLVDGVYSGAHPSLQQGPGLEFHDYRAYVSGDDPRAIDWKLYGRTDRYYLRRYRRETQLQGHLLVDISPSMAFRGANESKPVPAHWFSRWFGGGKTTAAPTATTDPIKPSKLDIARSLAAAIAMLGVGQSDRIGLDLADDHLTEHLPPNATWNHLQRLTAKLEQAQTRVPDPQAFSRAQAEHHQQAGSAFCDGLRQCQRVLDEQSLVVIISDLLDEPDGILDTLAKLRHRRCEVIVFQVLTPEELDLRQLRPMRLHLRDSETQEGLHTHLPEVTQRYQQLIGGHIQTIGRGCQARGIDHTLVRTDQSPLGALRHYLMWRQGR